MQLSSLPLILANSNNDIRFKIENKLSFCFNLDSFNIDGHFSLQINEKGQFCFSSFGKTFIYNKSDSIDEFSNGEFVTTHHINSMDYRHCYTDKMDLVEDIQTTAFIADLNIPKELTLEEQLSFIETNTNQNIFYFVFGCNKSDYSLMYISDNYLSIAKSYSNLIKSLFENNKLFGRKELSIAFSLDYSKSKFSIVEKPLVVSNEEGNGFNIEMKVLNIGSNTVEPLFIKADSLLVRDLKHLFSSLT